VLLLCVAYGNTLNRINDSWKEVHRKTLVDGERTSAIDGQPFCLVLTRRGGTGSVADPDTESRWIYYVQLSSTERESKREQENESENRKWLKNMAQPVLWEFKHIKTIELCHLLWCTMCMFGSERAWLVAATLLLPYLRWHGQKNRLNRKRNGAEVSGERY